MNSRERYLTDYDEACREDRPSLIKFLATERQKALDSYPRDVEVVYCSICGEPLVYKSLSYYEGYHMDNCV